MSVEDIIARLEKATGPDRELDAAIVALLNDAIVKTYPPSDDFGPHNRWQFWSADGKHFLGSEGKFPVPPYTSSIDAIVGLIERELPHHMWQVKHGIQCEGIVWALETDYDDRPVPVGYSVTVPAIALCIAFLKARAASPTSKSEGTR